MSDELQRVPRNASTPNPVWIQLGHGASINVSQGPLMFVGGVLRLLNEYRLPALTGTWCRMLTPYQHLIAAWWRPVGDAWFPHWYATDQVLAVMAADDEDSGLIAMIEMAMDGDFARAAAEELG